jgi:hypothetical protein
LHILETKKYGRILIGINHKENPTSEKEKLELLCEFQSRENIITITAITVWVGLDFTIPFIESVAINIIESPWGNQRQIHVNNY